MQFVDGGTLVWKVPPVAAADKQNVILSVSDAAGQEVFHSFELKIEGPEPAVAAVTPPEPSPAIPGVGRKPSVGRNPFEPPRASAPQQQSPYRTWTDKTGKYKMEARFVRLLSDGKVELLRKDGQTVKVPLAMLSDYDRGYAEALGDLKLEFKGASRQSASAAGRLARSDGSATSASGVKAARSGALSDYGLQIHVQPQGILKSLLPDTEFSVPNPGLHRVSRRRGVTDSSRAWAMVRVYNKGPYTIQRLVLTCRSDLPGMGPQTQQIEVTVGTGYLQPKIGGAEFPVYFRELNPRSPSAGAGRLSFSIAEIRYM
jgi:hypothetical protein